MSWESSLEYYRILNQAVQARLGGLHSARCLLYSVDFAEIELLVRAGDSPVPLFPTTRLHALAAVEYALS